MHFLSDIPLACQIFLLFALLAALLFILGGEKRKNYEDYFNEDDWSDK